jgi:hypothetical protein
MWPITTRVNKLENDDPSMIEPVQLASDDAASAMPKSANGRAVFSSMAAPAC